MMDYETAKLLSEADRAVQSALNGSMIIFVGAVVAIGALVLYVRYILDRWSWVPRKRQRKEFGVKF